MLRICALGLILSLAGAAFANAESRPIVRKDDFKPIKLIFEMKDMAHEKVINERCKDALKIHRPSNYQSYNTFKRYEDEQGELHYYQAPFVTGNIICGYGKIIKIFHWTATAEMNEFGEVVPSEININYFNVTRKKPRRW